MKLKIKNKLLITSLLLIPFLLNAQTWELVGEGQTSANLNAVAFADNQTVFAVGAGGILLKSEDAGATWNNVNHGKTTNDLWAIQFPTESTGYAAGAGGTVLKTTDGGATWTNISSVLPSNASGGILLGMYFNDADNGFIVGDPGLILQTTNGGTSWNSRNPVTADGYLRSIHFATNTTGYVVGNEGKIKISTDGGITWQDHTPATEPSLPDPKEMLCFGVNLSGGEFGSPILPGTYGGNYAYPTEADLDYFKSKNLKLIRFPFRWERVQHEFNGALNSFDLQKMKDFVQAAEDRNMPVILDMHNFARRVQSYKEGEVIISNDAGRVKPEYLADVWKKLAAEFKDYKNIWAYDIMNEPYSMTTSTPWFDIAQLVINAIREVDTETMIMVSGDRFSSPAHWMQYSDNLKNLVDPSDNLIFQAHIYFDDSQAGSYEIGGQPSTYEAERATPQRGVERMEPFVNWLKTNGLRGFVGEYGIPDDAADIDKWSVVLENMLQYLSDNKIPGTYWSAGPRWGTYRLSVQPTGNYTIDRPQMKVLEKFTDIPK